MTCAVAEHQGGKGTKIDIAAVVARATLHGVQFHPEKSAADGGKLLQRFLALPQGGAA